MPPLAATLSWIPNSPMFLFKFIKEKDHFPLSRVWNHVLSSGLKHWIQGPTLPIILNHMLYPSNSTNLHVASVHSSSLNKTHAKDFVFQNPTKLATILSAHKPIPRIPQQSSLLLPKNYSPKHLLLLEIPIRSIQYLILASKISHYSSHEKTLLNYLNQ